MTIGKRYISSSRRGKFIKLLFKFSSVNFQTFCNLAISLVNTFLLSLDFWLLIYFYFLTTYLILEKILMSKSFASFLSFFLNIEPKPPRDSSGFSGSYLTPSHKNTFPESSFSLLIMYNFWIECRR